MAEESTNKPTRRTERIGKYEILGHIATGGMGVIYKARDVDLDRLVALKILPPELAAQQTTLIRFEREAKAAARLRHENIVAIFDVGESNGTHFIALEFIEGTDLQDYINRKCRLDTEEARQIMIQAARALVHAHEQGIVHRDIKPSNFLLTHKDNRLIVKLTDFGLAIRHENDAEFRITRDKTTVGTVDYMSPEQARDSRSADIRSDIYSLGCTFYHMLAGLAPFARGTLPERIVQHMQAPPDLRKLPKSVPEDLVAIINRMLAKKPSDRYQTPAELLNELEHPDQVVVPGKRGPAQGKLERSPARKQAIEPTMVIENKVLDKESAEPKEVKIAKAKKSPSDAIEEKPRRLDVPAPRAKANEREQPTEDEIPTREKPRKKTAKSSPLWMYVTAGSVGLLVMVLIVTLIFGGRAPAPKPKEKPPDPPPIVEIVPEKIETPVVIDTSPAKMRVEAPALPIMDMRPDKADQPALRKEYYGPFAAFPEAPADATVLRMSRLPAAEPNTFHTLAEAFAQAKPNAFTVIEIHDNGPIYVPFLPAAQRQSILLRGAAGHRPLLVWDVPKKSAQKKSVSAFCTIAHGKLILENLDFAMKWTDDAPATVFDLPDTDFHARECTFSIAGTSPQGVALVRRQRSKDASAEDRTTHTWFKRCYVRGAEMSLCSSRESSAALLVEESLIVGYRQPLIDWRGRDEDALALHCVRSTLVTGLILLRWQALDGKGGAPTITGRILDSILSRDDALAPQGDMIQLSDGAELTKMHWRAANGIYAGWKQLLARGGKNIAGHDRESWGNQWFYRTGDRALGFETWPKKTPAGLEEQDASTFVPAQSPVEFAALTHAGASGCVIGWLPPAPEAWLERIFEPRTVPIVPAAIYNARGEIDPPKIDTDADGLYHGEVVDVTNVDLGVHLAGVLQKNMPAPRVVLHLTGSGLCQTSAVRVKGVQHLVLYFEPPKDFKEPLTLEAKTPGILKSSSLFEMTGGDLELIGLNVRLSPITTLPSVVQVHDGNLTMTRCWLQGPLTKSAEGFRSLISVSNANPIPTTLLLRDTKLVSGKLLIQMRDHVQLRARNNVFLSLGDGMQSEANRPTVPLLHHLDHNTWAVRRSFFTLRTGPEFQAAGRVLVHANSNAFLHPFANDGEKSALLLGGQEWMSHGRWNWQGRFNVYDSRLPAYLGGQEKTAGAKQALGAWQAVWGQPGERDSLLFEAGPASKIITTDNVQLDRLFLPTQLRGDLKQNPPGANLMGLGIFKKKG
jgi:serine/threonine protein kinase